MQCTETTGFDKELRICNYIKHLPRCNKGKSWVESIKNVKKIITTFLDAEKQQRSLTLFSPTNELKTGKTFQTLTTNKPSNHGHELNEDFLGVRNYDYNYDYDLNIELDSRKGRYLYHLYYF